ncbi:MAG: carbon-nitrogen hydrolase family protein [Treponema sp.]|nr:carbon-nitrogen hydrolase family protein [Treponema sp.]
MQKIYNLIAELCSYIIGSCTEDFFVKYSCISNSEQKRIHTLIRGRVNGLFSSENTIQQFSESLMTDVFFEQLNALVQDIKNERDYFAIVGLVQVLDESLETILRAQTAEFQQDDFSVVLNTNRESTGVGLLPRCSCVWERKRRLSHYYNRMDNFLFNLLLMDNSILGELIDKHFFLKNTLFPHFKERRALQIAATPLRLERNFTMSVYDENKVQYFKIDYTGFDFTADNELVWTKILTAGKKNSDIIIFPEMLGNPEMEGYISKKLQTLSSAERELIPSLIILPSYWKDNRNTVSILDKNGSVLCRQGKQNPFRVEQESGNYLEGINSSLVVNIFHYEGMGRMAILICKDFLTTKYLEQLMRCFKLTLIIVPSFSTGSYDFRQSSALCAHDDCNVVWINACAAMEKGKESNFENIGYVRKRIARTDDEAQHLRKMPACAGAFTGKCTHDCLFYETIQGV